MKKILKIIAASFCGIGIIAYTSMIFFPPLDMSGSASAEAARPVFIFLDILLIFFLYLLLRKKETSTAAFTQRTNQACSQSQSVSPYLPEVPAEILRDMKKHYGAMQLQSDIRIAQESFQLVQQTTDFDTFFMRLELAQQKALTLLQAAQAGCKGILNKQELIHCCEGILSNVQNAKMVFLDNSYKKETASAMQLKTKAGQHKRLCTYLERLQSYEDKFFDVQDTFDGFKKQLQSLIAEVQPNSKSSTSRSKQSSQPPADEIMKFKQLLDAEAITQEEYDTKKKQLLGL